jgi:hypothetical protein
MKIYDAHIRILVMTIAVASNQGFQIVAKGSVKG